MGQTPSRQTLPGHVPKAVKEMNLQPVSRLPATQRLNLTIGLPLRNQASLDALLQQIYDPTSPNYRHYLTPAQFAEQFGPTDKDYQAVIAFMQANGLQVTGTHPNRVVLDVSGTVGAIEKALHVTMHLYKHPTEAREFYAPDTDPSLDLAVPILQITGLDNYKLPFPKLVPKPLAKAAAVKPNAGSGPSGAYWGLDFRKAYLPGVSNTVLTGAGQSVALFELDGYYAVDITNYWAQSGLSNSFPFVPLVNVGNVTPGVNNGVAEVSLDIEMAIAMAPGLSTVYVYEGTSPDMVLNKIATDNLAKQIGCSWGWTPSPDLTAETIFKQMKSQGQSFFNASGDSCALTNADQWAPTTSTNITQVGGTTLTTGTGASYSSETVWNWGNEYGSQYDGVGSSGGISSYFPIPAYQQGISMTANHGSTSWRNVPDVALTADNIYVIYNNGSTGAFGGTSCAAPLWAAFVALANQQVASYGSTNWVGFANPVFYTLGKSANYTNYFHDITTGNNYWSKSTTNFPAVTGYDLCTGWGTPNGTNMINALAPFPTPVISAAGSTLLLESCTPTNNAIDPGETVTVNFALQNTSSMPTTNLVATLLATNGVTAPSAPQTYGVVSTTNSPVALPFSFTAAGTCGGIITATLQLQDGTANLGTVTFTFTLGGTTTTFAQNFDGVTAPALPSGWTTSASGTQSPWVTSTTTNDTAPNAAFSTDPANVGVNELVSPSIPIYSSSATLTFHHNYNLATGHGAKTGSDGAVLEISIGGGSFTNIVTAGGTFTTGGYNTTAISGNSGNPLAGEPGWTGSSGGFITSIATLPASAAGQNVQLRWRCGTSAGGGTGWYVDTISITDLSCCIGTSPVLFATPTSYNFGTLATGQTSNATFYVINIGAGTLTGNASVTSPFSVLSGSPFSINSGQTGIVNVAFSPLATGSYNANVIFTSNGGNSTNAVTGTAVTPAQLGVNPASYNFGTLATGTTSQTSFIVTNTGGAALTGTATTTAPFAILSGASYTVGGYSSTNVTVSFTPAAATTYNSNVIFTSNGGNSTNAVAGTGAIIPAASFTGNPTNGTAPLIVTFADTSTGTITNRFWNFGDGITTNITGTNIVHTFAAGTNTVTLITTGPVGVSTNSKPAYIIALTPPQLGVTPASYDFGTIATGTTAQTSFIITNTGQAALAGTASVPLPFAITAGTPFNIPGGTSTNLTVTFTPTTTGTISTNIIFTTNGGNATNTLSGTGAITPVASFTATPTNGMAPLLVTFTDASTGTITNRYWIFGDGGTTNTTATTVTYSYAYAGTNTVSLTVTGPLGGNTNTQVNLIITTPHDSVGDGIPDAWRAQYFGGDGTTTNAQSCATCDPDGDEFTNYQEYLAGTDPTNSASAFLITTTGLDTNNYFTFTFPTVAGKTYAVDTNYDLTVTNGWQVFTNNIAGTGSPITITDPASLITTNRFYRIRLQQP